jgi:uncharacterized protein YbbC (DUF1343 family)
MNWSYITTFLSGGFAGAVFKHLIDTQRNKIQVIQCHYTDDEIISKVPVTFSIGQHENLYKKDFKIINTTNKDIAVINITFTFEPAANITKVQVRSKWGLDVPKGKIKSGKKNEYILPIKPSPNLNTQQSIMLYPTTCMFEGTILSQGRGTQIPFTVLGAPLLKGKYTFNFTPKSIPGMSESPLHMNETCYGIDLMNYDIINLRKTRRINLQWMIDLYQAYPDKAKFFDRTQSKQMGNIDFLAGVYEFRKQIEEGKTAEEIQKTWEPGLSEYKKMRLKYVLYD